MKLRIEAIAAYNRDNQKVFRYYVTSGDMVLNILNERSLTWQLKNHFNMKKSEIKVVLKAVNEGLGNSLELDLSAASA